MFKKIQPVGDPHLGREFKHNVPLHRRGEREKLLRQQFQEELYPKPGVDLVLCLGDLFDKPQVSYETVWHAYGIVNNMASNYPDVQFWFLQGNHDESRNLDEITAWNLFGLLVASKTNIRCICDALVVPPYVFLPWSPRYTAVEQLALAVQADEGMTRGEVLTAYGHWDLDPRSADWNLIPTKELRAIGVTHALTGHVHKPDSFGRDGLRVTVFGSMQALAHGEDGGQGPIRYWTCGLGEFQDTDPARFKDWCVKVRLEPGEAVPEAPDCLNWQVERIVEGEDGDAFGVELTMDGFSLAGSYTETMAEADILPEVREKIDAKWNTIFGEPSSDTSSTSPASE